MAAQQPARASPELRVAPLSPRYRRNYTNGWGHYRYCRTWWRNRKQQRDDDGEVYTWSKTTLQRSRSSEAYQRAMTGRTPAIPRVGTSQPY